MPLQTVRTVLQKGEAYLKERRVSSGRRPFEEVLASILGVERLELYMDIDRPLEEDELQRLRRGLSRLGDFEPWQYIVGSVDFYGCKIQVNPDVLIPRQETEILADLAAGRIGGAATLWDVCCGSGCLGLSLKKKFPDLQVFLSDISEKALGVAQHNAELNDLEVEFRQGDLLQPFAGEKSDIIVCNPPYIGEDEAASLAPEVKNFEPRLALFAGENGLAVYERLSEELKDYLNPGGKVFLEIGCNQGEAVFKIFSNKGWASITLAKDWSGHDRFFFLES